MVLESTSGKISRTLDRSYQRGSFERVTRALFLPPVCASDFAWDSSALRDETQQRYPELDSESPPIELGAWAPHQRIGFGSHEPDMNTERRLRVPPGQIANVKREHPRAKRRGVLVYIKQQLDTFITCHQATISASGNEVVLTDSRLGLLRATCLRIFP